MSELKVTSTASAGDKGMDRWAESGLSVVALASSRPLELSLAAEAWKLPINSCVRLSQLMDIDHVLTTVKAELD